MDSKKGFLGKAPVSAWMASRYQNAGRSEYRNGKTARLSDRSVARAMLANGLSVSPSLYLMQQRRRVFFALLFSFSCVGNHHLLGFCTFSSISCQPTLQSQLCRSPHTVSAGRRQKQEIFGGLDGSASSPPWGLFAERAATREGACTGSSRRATHNPPSIHKKLSRSRGLEG